MLLKYTEYVSDSNTHVIYIEASRIAILKENVIAFKFNVSINKYVQFINYNK